MTLIHSLKKILKLDSPVSGDNSPPLPEDPIAHRWHEAEQQLLENVCSLREIAALDIMVPRADVVAFDCNAEASTVLEQMRNGSFSRYPVYRETLDDVIGYIQVKQVFDILSEGKALSVTDLLEKPLFIAPSMRVLDLLLQMRVSQIEIALVVDEYGGIDGLVTMQDLVEAIIGTIQNTDDSQPHIIEQRNGSLLVDGRAELEDLEQTLNTTFNLDAEDRNDIDTVGGLVFFLAGHVPVRGEIIKYQSDYEFEVLDADPRRIKWLRVLKK